MDILTSSFSLKFDFLPINKMASEESGNIEEVKKQDEDEESSNAEVSESDLRSVFVGNVHFKTTVEELKEIFGDCGTIERITIAEDK